ncbi:hypothetical protein [Streptosporangium longisporum]|uniref:hypothetical protein n=1 Tax=Streptosporangium longisporum TaxID=46187 RepID=UPI003CD0AFAA
MRDAGHDVRVATRHAEFRFDWSAPRHLEARPRRRAHHVRPPSRADRHAGVVHAGGVPDRSAQGGPPLGPRRRHHERHPPAGGGTTGTRIQV